MNFSSYALDSFIFWLKKVFCVFECFISIKIFLYISDGFSFLLVLMFYVGLLVYSWTLCYSSQILQIAASQMAGSQMIAS